MDSIEIQDILTQYNFSCLAISYINDTLFALYNETLIVLKLSKLSKLIEDPELAKNVILENTEEFKCEAPNGGCQIYLNFNDTILNLITFSGEIFQFNVNHLITNGKLENLGTIATGNSILRFIPSSESELSLVLTGSNELLLVKSNNTSLLLEDVSAVNWVNQSDSEIIFSMVDSNEVIIANINDIGSPIKSYKLELDESAPLITDFKFFSESKYVIITSDSELPMDQITFVVDGESIQKSDSIFTAYSMVDRLANSSVQILPNWSETFPELMIGISSKSEDISVLTPSTHLKPLNDQDIASLPMVDDNDSTTIGFAIDLTSSEDVLEPCKGVDKSSALPRLYILNDFGQLLSWDIWLSSDIINSKLNLGKSLATITSHKPKHISVPVKTAPSKIETKTATSFSFTKPEESQSTSNSLNTKQDSSTGFGSTGFGSTGFGSTGFGASGFGSTGFGSSGFGSQPVAAKSESTLGKGGFGSFANSTSAFGGLGNKTAPDSPFSGLGSTSTNQISNNNSLFGSQTTNTQNSIFGSSNNKDNTATLFGSKSEKNEPEQPKSIFGASLSNSVNNSPFGAASQNMGSGLFGSQEKAATTEPSNQNSLFGSNTKNTGSLFGTEKKPEPSLFNSQDKKLETPGLFGSFGNVKTNATPTSLFGNQSSTTPAANPFGNANSLGDFSGLSNAVESNRGNQFSFQKQETKLDFNNSDSDSNSNSDENSEDSGDDSEEEEELERLKLEEQRLFREAAEKKAEEDRLAKEAAEKEEKERLAKEAIEKEEQERLAKEAAEEEKKSLTEDTVKGDELEEEETKADSILNDLKSTKDENHASEELSEEHEIPEQQPDREETEVEASTLSTEEVEKSGVKKAKEQARLERESGLHNLVKKKNIEVANSNESPIEVITETTEEKSEPSTVTEIIKPTETATKEADLTTILTEKEIDDTTAETEQVELTPVSVDSKPEQIEDSQAVNLNINESVNVEPSYKSETTTFNKEEHKILAFEGDEAYQSKFYKPMLLPVSIARGSVEYPEDLNQYEEVGREIMKMVYDVDAEFLALYKNIDQLTAFLSDHNENQIIKHSLKNSSEFPSHWRFFEIETVVKGIKKITPDYKSINDMTYDVVYKIDNFKRDVFSLKKTTVSLGREMEDLERDITKSSINSNNIDRSLSFEQVQTRSTLKKMAAEVRNNYERLSEVVLILNSQIHPEKIINPQFESVLSTMQRSIHNHMDILRDLKYEVGKFGDITEKKEDTSTVKYGIKLNEDALRSQMEQILIRKRRNHTIREALKVRDFKIWKDV